MPARLARGLSAAALLIGQAWAADVSAPAKPEWEFALTAFPTFVRGGDNYTSGVAIANYGHLHLEARHNYEAIDSSSAFVGWNLSGTLGAFQWKLTPLAGGAWGSTSAFIPGVEAGLAWEYVDFYTESEYVRDPRERSNRYFYAWRELGVRPAQWLRLGLAAQRTRVYGGDRDLLAGPFGQVTWQKFTIGGFWFQPGSVGQVVVMTLGVAF